MDSIENVGDGHPLFMNVLVQYIRPKLVIYAKETFQTVIKKLLNEDQLDLETDPVVVRLLHDILINTR